MGLFVATSTKELLISLNGQPFTLLLTGPAGGSYVQGTGGADLELDAVEFCRILSRRAPGDGLLTEFVPF